MAFVFRLERVLSVRKIQEDEARQRHGEACQGLAEARGVLETLQECLARAQDGLDNLKHRDELTPEALRLHSLHLAGLRRKLEQARTRVSSTQTEVERSAAELLGAHRAREALERLREREEAAWRRRQAQREARELDEIAVSRHRP